MRLRDRQHLLLVMKVFLQRYRKPVVITTSVIVLQLLFGFDPKFFIINLIWLWV